MELIPLITSARSYLAEFDYDHYTACYKDFVKDAEPFFSSLTEENQKETIDRILKGLEEDLDSLSRKEAKDRAWQNKQVLALFLTPAALQYNETSKEFASLLQETWNKQYPKNSYYIAEYETIVKGFDHSALGITLRKSKRL